ncbi:dTDP-4-dehydrorhamnose reductase [Halanaeroarchaeum sp. HSR-CO]|uniref:SDR family oxidoreductase n=1 Tax=Halanaeroarchaeum sp. HSR-CO TaxID=2866382 RepID=UPI00217E53F0|nr:NAD(P)-dependent oxidoreductase [Halanaeroarchaeum sp. HSR-CO]UWG48133.1 dTDP-4-dehydrorhamnose reductase [Halanaeroarchaeum sp. HSR-CO]
MRILVMGVTGLLGSAIFSSAQDAGMEVVGTFHSESPESEGTFERLDIRDGDKFERVLDRYGPDVVINCAAMTDVDGCEQNRDEAFQINAQAPRKMAKRCRVRGIDFVQISTDYVFNGGTETPYTEESAPNPVQAYGQTKLAGEIGVHEVDSESLIVRTSFNYGIHGFTGQLNGFPAWVRDQLKSEGEVSLFTDQRITPTRVGFAAQAILSLIQRGASGHFHVASSSCVTPKELGRILTESLNLKGTLHSSTMSAVDFLAERPQYSCLATDKIAQELTESVPTVDADVSFIARSLSD